ncbi:aldo/keto reductase [Streptoalloteichus hindustanus]|uniref:Predicted oxidoreductase n=1 Tax=Streptoalloteichus hindustanus TaxID=2017 RepID=A0A1M4YUR0_STRHI|nr:aldo/keto reductase [Streptoalloteichus hindustanus]SHF09307.1 Predicted oxidoreductase [Streptoalloteichus hindustanus]
MRYTLFGRTGLRVSELCLGTMTFGEDWGWGAPKETAARILSSYAAAGGNFLDTADIYTAGTSESMLGELLAGRRDEFVLATKYTNATDDADVNASGNHRKNLVTSLEASLRRLRTDYVDVYWVHARDVWTPVEEVMRALDDQVRAGKVRYVAVSDWSAWEISRANTVAELRGWTPFSGVQLRYSLLERTPERELLPMARAFDLAVLTWGSLAEGRLTGKYLRGEGGRLDVANWAGDRDRDEVIVREVVRIAEEGGWSPARVALAWLRARSGTVVPILGVTTEDQLRDNLAALDVRLDEDQLARLDAVSGTDLGFPQDFLGRPEIVEVVYGRRWREVDDRRGTDRRTPLTG